MKKWAISLLAVALLAITVFAANEIFKGNTEVQEPPGPLSPVVMQEPPGPLSSTKEV